MFAFAHKHEPSLPALPPGPPQPGQRPGLHMLAKTRRRKGPGQRLGGGRPRRHAARRTGPGETRAPDTPARHGPTCRPRPPARCRYADTGPGLSAGRGGFRGLRDRAVSSGAASWWWPARRGPVRGRGRGRGCTHPGQRGPEIAGTLTPNTGSPELAGRHAEQRASQTLPSTPTPSPSLVVKPSVTGVPSPSGQTTKAEASPLTRQSPGSFNAG